MLASVTHVVPVTSIRRERLLPVPGRVLVRAGQQVGPVDVIAEANISVEHVVLEIARGLKVNPNAADRMVERQIGDHISEGDVIAGKTGIFSRVIRAPQNGRVVSISGGQVLLEVERPPFELKAGFPGTVAELVPDMGAIIVGSGALIQGVWGNNRVDTGMLLNLMEEPDTELKSTQMDISMRGSVPMAGYCSDPEVFRIAGELPLRGLILASMPSKLIPAASQATVPVIVIEGFGKIPLCAPVYKLLTTNEKREISVNAHSWNRFAGVRPEIIISLPSAGTPAASHDAEYFSPGQVVRVAAAPYLGMTGTLISLRPGTVVMPNGIRTQAAMVHLESGKQDLVPLANLELFV